MTDINLDQMRQDIDNIDEKLTDLFKERMEKSLEIAKYKKDHKVPVFSDKREKEILHKVSEQIGEPFDGYARLLFNTIFDASRSCPVSYTHLDVYKRQLYGRENQTLWRSLTLTGFEVHKYVFPGGEDSKNMETIEERCV